MRRAHFLLPYPVRCGRFLSLQIPIGPKTLKANWAARCCLLAESTQQSFTLVGP